MKYKIDAIEHWICDGQNYPLIIKFDYFNHYLNNQCDYNELKKIEKKLKNFTHKRNKVISLMNPLYPMYRSTVITCELSTKNPFKKPRKINMRSEFKLKLKSLVIKHKKKIENIQKSGNGDLSGKRYKGIIYSQDPQLNKIEKQINRILDDNLETSKKNLREQFDPIFIYSLQWGRKDKEIIDILIKRLEKNIEEEINLILRQFIPMLKYFSDSNKKKIYKIIKDHLLLLPSPFIRNKSISLLSEIPEIVKEKKLIKYIENLSRSKQLNISYPAKDIINFYYNKH